MIIAGEDQASLAIIRRVLVGIYNAEEIIPICAHGRSKLQARIPELVRSCHGGLKVVVCADLDMDPCLLETRNLWFPNGVPRRMVFSLAKREVDAWLLADPGLSAYLSSAVQVPQDPQGLQDPKSALLNIARRSSSREIREAMVKPDGSLSRVGPGYNTTLADFVLRHWNMDVAAQRATTFRRFRDRIAALVAM